MTDDSKKPDDLELLHTFAHDLKTPIHALRGYIDLVAAVGDLNDKQKYWNSRAHDALERIWQRIDQLLNYADQEANMVIRREPCDLLDILDDNLGLLEVLAQERDVTIHTQVDPDAQFIHADPKYIGIVLDNLISNAIKYNRIGGTVTVRATEHDDWVKVEVSDTGIGIARDDLDNIFERFYRVNQPSDSKIEGTGLGLSIVRSIILKHGGQIWADSTLGEGTTIGFIVQAAMASSYDYDREPADDLDDRHQESHEHLDDSDSRPNY